jgi:hypothetical protein
MQYYLVQIDGRMGFEYAANAGHAKRTAAREMGYTREDMRDIELEAQSLDVVALEDVNHIVAMGGYVPFEVREYFSI